MKQRIIQKALLLLLLLAMITVLSACLMSTKTVGKAVPSAQPITAQPDAAETATDESAAVANDSESDYEIIVDGHVIPLRAWDYEMQLDDWLGEPLVESVTELTEGADTHTGSLVKNVSYEGLQLQLFSPSHNREQFWLLSIDVTSNNYSTSKGAMVGDSVERLKELYPNIDMKRDGRIDPNNSAYSITDDAYTTFLTFEVEEGYVSSIQMHYEIP